MKQPENSLFILFIIILVSRLGIIFLFIQLNTIVILSLWSLKFPKGVSFLPFSHIPLPLFRTRNKFEISKKRIHNPILRDVIAKTNKPRVLFKALEWNYGIIPQTYLDGTDFQLENYPRIFNRFLTFFS